ncbi:hypothetical protein MKK65_12780 [Methylobacterium sp. J-001]|uniref:hypothetical protein n=1 Tax=Methylobacterium sp. J-001 TaxID=2836609 RepID=UPI001FB9AD88|nr:hypothetical protein [Methylobacterium sp. J-001]MCJ2117424.1 hypothetical protein [Methylobacterium sp. J-001]
MDDQGTDAEAGPDAGWRALHADREAVERALSLAQARQRYGTDAEAIAQARLEEAELLVDLDRILTQIRAAEYRRRPGSRRW